MIAEKKVINYGQQKATRKSNQYMVKSYVRLRMQKYEHEIKKINNWKSFTNGILLHYYFNVWSNICS